MLGRYLFLLPLFFLIGNPVRGEDAASTGTLVIAARDVSGNPLEDVEFVIGDTGATSRTVRTNALGMARTPLLRTEAFDEITPQLADERYQLPTGYDRRMGGSDGATVYLFARLFPASFAGMSDTERSSYIDMLPAVYTSRWEAGEQPSDPPHALWLAAFLEGFGEEEVPDMAAIRRQAEEARARAEANAGETEEEREAREAEERKRPTLTVTLVDRSGSPVYDRLVLLYTLGTKPGTFRIARSGRTDRLGHVHFTGLDYPGYYRPAVVAGRRGTFAPGPIVHLDTAPQDQPELLRKRVRLVLRESARSLSGMVVDENGLPARSVRLATNDPTQPAVETMTDEFGYFELGPLRPGGTAITIQEPRTRRTAQFTTPIGGDQEVLIPLDVLMPRSGR